MKLCCQWLTLPLITLLTSQLGWADCYERYYSQEHLQTYPRQVVRSVILNSESWYQGTDETKVDLQIHLVSKGQTRLLALEALCQGANTLFCKVLNGQGEFELQLRTTEEAWPFDRQSLLKLKPGTFFKDVTLGSSPGLNAEIPEWDRTMMLHANPLAEAFSGRCETQISQAHRVSPYRLWNEINLLLVRHDLARPTITARNLYHLALLHWNLTAQLTGEQMPRGPLLKNLKVSDERELEILLHYASFTLLQQRYAKAPGNQGDRFPEFGDGEPDLYIQDVLRRTLLRLGLQEDILKLEPEVRLLALMGAEAAESFIAHMREDGSLEDNEYRPLAPMELHNVAILDTAQSGLRQGVDYNEIIDAFFNSENSGLYSPETFDLEPYLGPSMNDTLHVDHWARLNVPGAVDQSGNSQPSEQSPLTLFWGQVETFSDLSAEQSSSRPGVHFEELLDLPRFSDPQRRQEMIKLNLDVMIKSAALNPLDMSAFDFDGDGVGDKNPGAELMDISPASQGNNPLGTNAGSGYSINPVTGLPYQANWVRRGDYYRALAEYWADGPESETPPGHWNLIANYVVDEMEKNGVPFRWQGQGQPLRREDFERRLYLTLNGALHDAAVVAWGIKGSFQGNRPVTALRQLAHLAEQDPELARQMVELAPNHVKMVTYTKRIIKPHQPAKEQVVTKMAFRSWRGPTSGEFFGPEVGGLDLRDLSFQERDELAKMEHQFFWESGIRGVGWLLADNWLPYQRSSFVTPPFPGFVSGHSTFSRAAAEVLSLVTGSPYFPGGLGRHPAPFLHFEAGPTEPFDFQWATYYDAADESGISRIYGGIHAAYDDQPGRKIGAKIGHKAVERASTLFSNP